MGEHTPESDEQQPETQQQRGERLARELLERHVSKPDEPSELFDATPYDTAAQGRAEAAETIAGIDAQNEAKLQSGNAAREAEEAAELEGKTPHERNLARSKRMLADVQKADDEASAIQSPAREDETGKLVDTNSSVEGAAQIEAAQKAVEAAAAQAPAAEAAEKKAAAIEAAHVGAERVRQVLEAISDDRDQSPLDLAYQRVSIAVVRMKEKLEAIDAKIVKAKLESTSGEAPATLTAAYADISSKNKILEKKGEALKELIERNKTRSSGTQEAPDHQDEPS